MRRGPRWWVVAVLLGLYGCAVTGVAIATGSMWFAAQVVGLVLIGLMIVMLAFAAAYMAIANRRTH